MLVYRSDDAIKFWSCAEDKLVYSWPLIGEERRFTVNLLNKLFPPGTCYALVTGYHSAFIAVAVMAEVLRGVYLPPQYRRLGIKLSLWNRFINFLRRRRAMHAPETLEKLNEAATKSLEKSPDPQPIKVDQSVDTQGSAGTPVSTPDEVGASKRACHECLY